MKVIGITGGAGSGKSFICSLLTSEWQIPVIDSDTEAKKILDVGSPVIQEIVQKFGSQYLTESGTLNRHKMAELIFRDSDARIQLNKITHPATMSRIRKQIEEYRQQDIPYLFIESALMDQVNFREFCDEIWYVYADTETRIARLKRHRDYTQSKISPV